MLSHVGTNSYMLGAMDHNITALERAFQLAGSGECDSVEDLKKRLKAEGYSTKQIVGRELARQLRGLITVARAKDDGPKGQKHPHDVMRLAAADFLAGDGKDKAAQSLGQRGGRARAKALSAGRRREIAQKATATRWKN